ncbi:hypothetical protein [Mycobacterium sp.]|uniref:hypothetical protein n=1 Tax=Mycobacterium sp. TaxID=1785 RepID=UPI003F9618BA
MAWRASKKEKDEELPAGHEPIDTPNQGNALPDDVLWCMDNAARMANAMLDKVKL